MVMAIMVAPGMLPYKLEFGEGSALYNPQEVLWQVSYDQGAVTITGDSGEPSDAKLRGTVYMEGLGQNLGAAPEAVLAIL